MKKIKSEINLKKNQAIFCLDTKIYSLEVVYSTSNNFLDRAYVFLDGDPAEEIIVSLKGKEVLSKKQLEALKGEFGNELLNCLLRAEVTKNNQKMREYIVASALVSGLPTSLVAAESEANQANWQEDPLGIAVPWEKKFKKSKK